MINRLSRLIPDLSSTIARFPIPSLISLLLAIYANLDVANSAPSGLGESNQIYFAGAAAFMAAGAAHYFAQARQWARGTEILFAAIAGALTGAVPYFETFTHVSELYLFAGLLPLLMIAGFLRPGAKQGALWLFNLRLGLAALLAIIVAVIFAAGLSAIVESLNFLFEAGLPDTLHERIWATAASLVGPIYGLSLAPRDFSEEVTIADHRDTLLERGVSVLVNYVLVPIAIVYALILHAYAVKIALDGTLPKNQIGTMVTIYALGGTGAWLIAWPWRDSGTRLLRWFMRGWFWLTIIPAGLLVLAVWERVSVYGMTPDRYGLVLVAVWLVAVTLYLAFRRNRADMRLILGGFAVLLLIGAAGPWGANGMTIADQFARFMKLAAESKVVGDDGKFGDPPSPLQDDAKRSLYSIVQTLRDVGGLDRLKPFFAGRPDDPFAKSDTSWALMNAITEVMKLNQWESAPTYVSFSANLPLSESFAGPGRLIGPMQGLRAATGTEQGDLIAWITDKALTIRIGDRKFVVPVKAVVERVAQGTLSQGEPLRLEIAPGVTMLIIEINGDNGERPILNGISLWLLLKG